MKILKDCLEESYNYWANSIIILSLRNPHFSFLMMVMVKIKGESLCLNYQILLLLSFYLHCSYLQKSQHLELDVLECT